MSINRSAINWKRCLLFGTIVAVVITLVVGCQQASTPPQVACAADSLTGHIGTIHQQGKSIVDTTKEPGTKDKAVIIVDEAAGAMDDTNTVTKAYQDEVKKNAKLEAENQHLKDERYADIRNKGVLFLIVGIAAAILLKTVWPGLLGGGVGIGLISTARFLTWLDPYLPLIITGLLVAGAVWGILYARKHKVGSTELVSLLEQVKPYLGDLLTEKIFGKTGLANQTQSASTKSIVNSVQADLGVK